MVISGVMDKTKTIIYAAERVANQEISAFGF
jgi:hypothetical protein